MNKLKRIAACLLIAVFLAGSFSATSAEAALSKPTNCRFVRWNSSSSKFTSCRIAWNKVSGARYYQVMVYRTDGTNKATLSTTKTNMDIEGFFNNQIYSARVRAVRGSTYSAWSNIAYITPLPSSSSFSKYGSMSAKISWNRIYRSSGYRVYMTTNPSGKWYLVKTTGSSASTSAVVSKYRGSKLKTYTNYYVRVVPKLVTSGVTRKVPVPSGYNLGYFYFYSY